jgi:aryl-alcohol dehydrogenase-like predicted oxidoreductase
LGILKVLDQVAEKHQTVPASVALAWLSAQPNIGGPVASATSQEQLQQILSATTLELDPEDLQVLHEASK